MTHEYKASIAWQRGAAEAFTDLKFSRAHQWSFDGGITVPGSSSPWSVRVPYSRAEAIDPEEALVAALASCHMLTFLYLAAKQGFVVDQYVDEAVGIMTKNAGGKLFVSRVVLRPRITFSGAKQPSAARTRRTASPRARGLLHRQFGSDRGRRRGGAGFAPITGKSDHALSAAHRRRSPGHAGQNRRHRYRCLVRHGAEGQAAARPARSADGQRRARSRAQHGPAASAEHAGGFGAILCRGRRLQAPFAGQRRSPDPALRVLDLLHAISTRDRPGHAAIPVRVPDPGGHAHRDGGGQCLHVRRLDGGRRSGADGAPVEQATPRRAGRQPASALPGDHRDRLAHGG